MARSDSKHSPRFGRCWKQGQLAHEGTRRHLAVADEEALITARARIEGKGIETYLFHEPDVDGYTAFPSQPIAAMLKSKRKAFYPYPRLRSGVAQ